MISSRVGSNRFHYRAVAVIIDDRHLLLRRLECDSFWALPGGRVNAGETGEAAIHREFVEELGVKVVCGPLLCTGENFFEYEGHPHHEEGPCFSVSLFPSSELLAKDRVHAGTEAAHCNA